MCGRLGGGESFQDEVAKESKRVVVSRNIMSVESQVEVIILT